MGTTLTGTTPQDTYDSLIKVTDNGPLSGTLKALSDGLGNDSTLSLSTTAASIAGTLSVTGNATFDTNTLFVDAAANEVGIGTVTPAGKLQVTTDRYNDSLTFNATAGLIIGGTLRQLAINTNDTAPYDMSMQAKTNGNTASNLILQSLGGSIGIGTSAPAQLLHVSGGSARIQRNVSGATSEANEQVTIWNLQTPAAGNQATIGFHLNSTSWGSDFTAARISAVQTNAASGATDLAFGTSVDGSAAVAPERFRITANGVTFNGDTAAANALDDYEEGTWTMGVSFNNASVGVTTSNNTGSYTKIGRKVTANGLMTLTSKGSSTGDARITGLPFAIGSGGSNYSSASLYFGGLTFTNQFQGYGPPATTTIDLREITSLGIEGAITDADFANNTTVIVSFTYFV